MKLWHLFLFFILNACSSLLYHPSRRLFVTPNQIGYSYQETFVQNIPIWSIRKGKAQNGTILQVHGNGDNMTGCWLVTRPLLQHQYEVVAFDYEGYGARDGEPNPENTVQDTRLVMEHIRAKDSRKPFFLLCQSLGTNVCLRAITDSIESGTLKSRDITGVIIDSGFQSYRSAASSVVKQHWLTFLLQPFAWLVMSDAYSVKGRLHLLKDIPILVLHGSEDRVIRPELGRELFEGLQNAKEWLFVEGIGHIQGLSHPPTFEQIRDWMERTSAAREFIASNK